MYLQTRGFVLRAKKVREVDKVFTIFTEKAGKLEMQARGVCKITSKLRGHLQPFAEIHFNLAHGKFRYQLIGASLSWKYNLSGIRQIAYGYYILELVDRLQREQQPNAEIYSLMHEVMGQLEHLYNEESLKRIRVAFLLKILKLTGFNPEGRTRRDPTTQAALTQFLNLSLEDINHLEMNGELARLFQISQFALNETIEQPMQTVKFLKAI